MPEFVCLECSRPFWVSDTDARFRPCHYCSRRCSARARSTGAMRHCGLCQRAFYVKAHALRDGWGKYCSQACYDVARRRGQARACLQCGTPFYRGRGELRQRPYLYCSVPCRLAHRTLRRRFLEKVQIPDDPDACWVWTASVNEDGYGHLWHEGRLEGAHRVAWQLYHGPIPAAQQVNHTCDHPWCVNALKHLYLGTQLQNIQDTHARGRHRAVPQPGEANGFAKLTAAQVLAIRASTAPSLMLARQYHVCPTTIGRVRQRRTWKHL